MNGPLPTKTTGPKSFPYFVSAAGEMIPRYGVLAPSRNAAYGLLNRTRTVYGSTTSVRSYGPMKLNAVWDLVSGSTILSKVTFTASAVSGVPSWNLTSLRSLNVLEVGSGEGVQGVESCGGEWH